MDGWGCAYAGGVGGAFLPRLEGRGGGGVMPEVVSRVAMKLPRISILGTSVNRFGLPHLLSDAAHHPFGARVRRQRRDALL